MASHLPQSGSESRVFHLDQLHSRKGWENLKQGEIEQAIERFHKALHMNPSNASAHNGLGASAQEESKSQDAIQHYQQALATGHKEPHTVYCNLGNSYFQLGQYEKALVQYLQAASLSPNSWRAHTCLGLTYAQINDFGQAIFHYHRAIRLQPQFSDNYYNLAVIYYQQSNRAAARKYLRLYLERFPQGEMWQQASQLLHQL